MQRLTDSHACYLEPLIIRLWISLHTIYHFQYKAKGVNRQTKLEGLPVGAGNVGVYFVQRIQGRSCYSSLMCAGISICFSNYVCQSLRYVPSSPSFSVNGYQFSETRCRKLHHRFLPHAPHACRSTMGPDTTLLNLAAPAVQTEHPENSILK